MLLQLDELEDAAFFMFDPRSSTVGPSSVCEAVLLSVNGAAFDVGDGCMVDVDVLCCTVATLRITGLRRTERQVYDTQLCGVTYCEDAGMTQREQLPQGKVNADFRGLSQNKYDIGLLN